MKLKRVGVLAIVGLAGLLLGGSSALAQDLGTAESFAVLGASEVTNTGPTKITGDLGINPGSAITGFPPGIVIGTIHGPDAVTLQAQSDVTIAYNVLTGLPCDMDLTGTDLGGLTLTAGVYCFDSTAGLTGTLTLDAEGNPDAKFIFKVGSALTTASNSRVVMTNGANPCNVFWQIVSSATIGTDAAFAGNIIALASITLTTRATLSGRALARTGAVTMDGNTISIAACLNPPGCPVITVNPDTLPGGVVGTPYMQTVSAAGSTAVPFTFAVASGELPDGLSLNPGTGVISGTPTTAGLFVFTVTATDTNDCTGIQAYSVQISPEGCPLITLSPSALPNFVVGTAYAQTVTASPAGTYTYTVSSGALPDGLMLDVSTGVISGTPTALGLFGFTITATDSNACTGARAYTLAAECADLSIQKTASSDRVPTGGRLTYFLTVGNAGPGDAVDVEVVDAIPDEFSVEIVRLPPGWSSSLVSDVLTARTPLLLAGASVVIEVEVRAITARRSVVNEASVSSATQECDLDDNRDDVTVRIHAPANPGVPALSEIGAALLALLLGGTMFWIARRS